MNDTYEVTPDPTVNASRYAYLFTNRDATEYAAEWLDSLDEDEPATDDDIDEWAHETADGMAAVIYTGQALALYAAGITADEDEDGYAEFAGGESVPQIINQLATGLAYAWHRRILADAARAVVAERDGEVTA